MEKLFINFIRGDYYVYRFQIKNENKENIKLGDKDNLMFSMKKNYNSDDYILQKVLNNGIIWDEEMQCYAVIFEHEDTTNFTVLSGVFDIVIIYEGTKPETHTGKFELDKDVTRNEVQNGNNSEQ